MKKFVMLTAALILVVIPLEAQMTKEEKRQIKKEKAEQDYQRTKQLIESNSYTFVALQANPLGGQRIFINTTPNYVVIDGDQADIYLPYYGVVRAGTGYGPDAGIKFTGTMDGYTVKINDEKQSIFVTFEIDRKFETHEFNFTIERGGTTNLQVAGSKRNSINYFGEVSETENRLTN